jgi:hypothetical protein
VDLTGELMRLNIPKGTKLLENVALNPYFSDTLGDFINNPAFVSPSTASGTVSVTIQQCEKFPLAELDPATASSDPGRLEVVMSMTKLHLGNPTMVKVLDQVASFAGADFAEQSLQGEIKEAHVVMEKGTVKQDVTIATGENGREIRIAGGANLLTSELVDMNFYIGPQFLKQWGGDLPKFFPEGLPIALSGTTRSVHFDVQRQITQGLGKQLTPETLGKIIGGFTSKKNDRDKRKASPTPNAGASPPATPGSDATTAKSAQPATPAQAKEPEQDLVGAIGDLLGGKKGETDKEKEERRAQRRRERELEQQRLQQQKAAATQPTPPVQPEKKPKKK